MPTLNALLALVVLAFAGLVASFAARNSDVWRHLAAGRLLAQLNYQFGNDPFAYTTQGVYWANHSWLFDLLAYLGYRTLGGAALVGLKAILIVGLAGLMLNLARPREGDGRFFWAAGLCVLLALLAMSPRLQLEPMTISIVLLGACLLLLNRGGRAWYALPAVIALWVNLDDWFILGPLVVVLFALGQYLERPSADLRRMPIWLIVVCLGTCLLNPHGIEALTLPAELSPAVWRSEFRHDPRFAELFASPWHRGDLGRAGGYNLAAWAFFVLLAVSVVSFVVNAAALRSWRLLVIAPVAGLAAWQIRLVPFFAVVAGPIAALNLRDAWEARARGLRTSPLVTYLPCLLVGLAGVALVALTWPGWLNGFHRHQQPLAWDVPADPSLKRAAQTLAQWRQNGTLPADTRVFAQHPDLAHYSAWFAPGERQFLDSRLPLFTRVAADFERVAQSLDPSLPGVSDGAGPPRWPATLRDQRIVCAMLYDPDAAHRASSLRQLVTGGGRWGLLRVEGHAVILGWRDAPERVAVPRFLAGDEAFKGAGKSGLIPEAPSQGPSLNRPFPWWHAYLDRPGGTSCEAGAAGVYAQLYDYSAMAQLGFQRNLVLARFATGLVGAVAHPSGPAEALTQMTMRLKLDGLFAGDLMERSAAFPLLAIRSARAAVAAHPDDADAWVSLAHAYLLMKNTTSESLNFAFLSPLLELRRMQAAAALMQAVNLKPNLPWVHDSLARLFAEMQFFDLALRHRELQVRQLRAAGPAPGEDAHLFADRVDRIQQDVDSMRTVVQENENRFVVQTQAMAGDPLGRARRALDLALAGKALEEVLLRSHPDLYGTEGLNLLARLLLLTGRAWQAKDLLQNPDLRSRPEAMGDIMLPGGANWAYRFPAYDWYDLGMSAATGDYDRAAAALARLREQMKQAGETIERQVAPELARRVTAEVGLGAAPSMLPPRLFARMRRDESAGLLVSTQFLVVERADLHVLDGMLRLERGQPGAAREQFQSAIELYDRAADTAPARPGLPLARRYLERMRQ